MIEIPVHDAVRASARVYLAHGAAPRGELQRVLAAHLELPRPMVQTHVHQLIADGELALAGDQVSLPSGSGARDDIEIGES